VPLPLTAWSFTPFIAKATAEFSFLAREWKREFCCCFCNERSKTCFHLIQFFRSGGRSTRSKKSNQPRRSFSFSSWSRLFFILSLASLDSAAACFTGRRRALRLGTCDVATIRPGLQHLIWRHWRRQTGTSTEMVVVRPEQDYFFLLMASYDMLSNMT
jgi:hypothetical protein